EGGDDTIDGGLGADRMYGGIGNDTFIVDNTNDEVLEESASGVDLIIASVNYELPAWVENLDLTGSGGITGIGNELDNRITDGTGSNNLRGGAGNDVLSGGDGFNTIDGGSGSNTAFYSEPRAHYQVGYLGNLLTVSTPTSHDLLTNIQTLQFADASLAPLSAD